MIKNFNDYAANERTFLAWGRTAIALMAFGFLLERFDLFLQMAALTMGDKAPHIADAGFGRGAGLGLLLAGVAITAVARELIGFMWSIGQHVLLPIEPAMAPIA